MRTKFKINLIIFAIISLYALYTTAQLLQKFYHNETKNYEGTLNTSRAWEKKMYDNGTVVLRIIRIKDIPRIDETIGICTDEKFSLRIIYRNGTVVEKDLDLEIPLFNYCSRFDVTNGKNLELIEYYLIGKNYILVTYYDAINSSDFDTYEDWGIIIDFDGKTLDRIRFGISFVADNILKKNTLITLNVNREKGFIRLSAIKGSANAQWQQFQVDSDGKITTTTLTNGTLEFVDYSSLSVDVISTVDEGYAMVFANTTGLFSPQIPVDNSTMMIPQCQVFAIPIRYNETQIEPLLLYQTPIPNLIIESLFCNIASVGVGQVCLLTVRNPDNLRFVSKIAFLSSGSVFSFTNINYVIPEGATFNEEWKVVSLPFGGFLLTNSNPDPNGGKGNLIYGYILNNDTESVRAWSLEEPHLANANGLFLVLPNNTLMMSDLEIENDNSWSFTMIELPKIIDRNDNYSNPNIESSSPMIDESFIPGKSIEINFYDPVELSDGQIEIHKMEESGQSSLRQVIPSRDCSLTSDSKTVVVFIYNCTFSVPNEDYFIKMDNNFVKSKAYREPLLGIKEEIWKVKPNERIDGEVLFYPTLAIQLRLTDDGTRAYDEYYSTGNRMIFFDSLIKELADAVPIDSKRLESTKNVEIVSNVENYSHLYLISVVIKHVDSGQMVGTVFKDIRMLVKNKKYTPISTGKFTNYLDDTFDIEITTNLWEKYKYGLLSVFLVGLVVGPSFFFFTRKENDNNEEVDEAKQQEIKQQSEDTEKKLKDEDDAEKGKEKEAAKFDVKRRNENEAAKQPTETSVTPNEATGLMQPVENKDLKDQNLKDWIKNNMAIASAIITLSCADVEVMTVLILDDLPIQYKAPFSKESETYMYNYDMIVSEGLIHSMFLEIVIKIRDPASGLVNHSFKRAVQSDRSIKAKTQIFQ
ncbi:13664_t:CDS:2 [Funneliformis geosporum]|nr:13664_t:CDS:2 [Funneliformis geosporum]